jgi:hypothetical protein
MDIWIHPKYPRIYPNLMYVLTEVEVTNNTYSLTCLLTTHNETNILANTAPTNNPTQLSRRFHALIITAIIHISCRHILNVNVIQSMHYFIPKVQLLLLLVQPLLLDTQTKLGCHGLTLPPLVSLHNISNSP